MDSTHGRTGESLLQLEIQKVQQSFAMSSNDEPEEFEDIQFFHRLPPALGGGGAFKGGPGGGDIIRGAFLTSMDGDSSNEASESPYVFPENVLEYGEPQFFPGNCVGYLETILEETDEEYEEEEEAHSSGRHWWTADSDTDTESVIRVDPPPPAAPPTTPSHNCGPEPALCLIPSFRTTASSKPFEMEDLYLLDQLDLAFEETLMKPRRRAGLAFGRDLGFLQPQKPLTPDTPEEEEPTLRAASPNDEEEPPEVNEEDFFYSTSEEDGSGGSDETGGESSSSDEEKKGVVLAEFSLNSSFGQAVSKGHRRSFEGPAGKIRSFRSFDGLNSLAGTELLFSKADTFPSFAYIKEVAEPGAAGGIPAEKEEVSRKNSGGASSENLSEDSGISDATGTGSVPALNGPDPTPGPCPYIQSAQFALNPLVYSSGEYSLASSTGPSITIIASSQSENEARAWKADTDGADIDEVDYVRPPSRPQIGVTTTEEVAEKSMEFDPGLEPEPESSAEATSTTGRAALCPEPGLQSESETGLGADIVTMTTDDNGSEVISSTTTTTPQEQPEPAPGPQSGPMSTLGSPSHIESEEEPPGCIEEPNINGSVSNELEGGEDAHRARHSWQPILSESNLGSEEEEEPLHLCTRTRAWICGTELKPKPSLAPDSVHSVPSSESDPPLRHSQARHVPIPTEDPLDLGGIEMEVGPHPRTASPVPVPHKTYGAHGQVEVYLVSSRTPSPPVAQQSPSEFGSLTKPKSVHFSPVVSEISWRESYTELEPDLGSQDQLADHPDGGSSPERSPIERVQVHSQVISGPVQALPKKSEKERLMQLEPSPPPPLLMSTVPDLLSGCDGAGVDTSHMEVRIQDGPPLTQEEAKVTTTQVQQQQIFPTVFVGGSKVNGAQKKTGKKGFSIPLPSSGKKVSGSSASKQEKENVSAKKSSSSGSSSSTASKPEKENAAVKEKPGFFQRLSKIRLSGSSSNSKGGKVRIYPKEKEAEPLKPSGNVNGNKPPGQPILKKGSSGSPAPVILQSETTAQDECSEAFENILEEIAGLNTILQRQSLPAAASSGKRSFAERKQFLSNPDLEARPSAELQVKLSQFKAEAVADRDLMTKAHPDLETMEGVSREGVTGTAKRDAGREKVKSPKKAPGDEGAEGKTEREWYRLLKSAAEKYYHGGSRGDGGAKSGVKTGIVETDLDTGTSREMLDAELVILDLDPPPLPPTPCPPANGSGPKARSLSNLSSSGGGGGGGLKLSLAPADPSLAHELDGLDELLNDVDERAKSLEFLLDENQKNLSLPPENQLRYESHRVLSEHELRIQRALDSKVNVPDWYRRSQRSKSVERPADLARDSPHAGTTTALKLLKRTEYGSSGGLAGGWAGLSAYRAPSLSSLQSARYAGSLNRSNFVRGRPVTMSVTRSSRESLLSPSSTASQSPSAFERSSFTYGMPLSLTRFGQSRLSSTSGTSPGSASPPSTPGPASAPYVRKPYLGWRSQERLNSSSSSSSGPSLSVYRPPAERLAADPNMRQRAGPVRPTGADRPPLPKPPPRSEKTSLTAGPRLPPSPSVHDSIREVTNAINQFVAQGTEEPPRVTPRQRHAKKPAVWFESSFVGQKPK